LQFAHFFSSHRFHHESVSQACDELAVGSMAVKLKGWGAANEGARK